MRVGQHSLFFAFSPESDLAGKVIWFGVLPAYIFTPPPLSQWVFTALDSNEDPNAMVGSKVFEVVVKEPVTEG